MLGLFAPYTKNNNFAEHFANLMKKKTKKKKKQKN